MTVVQPHTPSQMIDRQRREAIREARKYRKMITEIQRLLTTDHYDTEENIEQALDYIKKELKK